MAGSRMILLISVIADLTLFFGAAAALAAGMMAVH